MMLGRINWKPRPERIRSFSLTLIVAVLLFALVVGLLGSWRAAVWIAAIGTLMGLIGYLLTPVGRIIYLIWMGTSYLIGRVTSPIFIGIIFFLIITPLGLLRRLFGHDPLQLRPKGQADSHFLGLEEQNEPERFRRQF